MAAPLPGWFKKAVIYQIYPQSFYDSNNDGIGDLPGIISKLDYIASLGVNTLWLNPIFDSPFQDAGYDVRDYYKVAERYGTMEDLKNLFAEVHKRDMHILLDLVPGHTSMEHRFFQEAVSDKPSEYDNYYMFTNGDDDDRRGYNFISGYGKRNGFYMINYYYCQPALNFGFLPPEEGCSWQLPMDHPDVIKVREEIRNVMKFYLDMGCDGFRVDMAASLVRGKDRLEGVTALWRDYTSYIRKNYPEAVLISEWGYPKESLNAGFDADFMLSMAGLNVIDLRKGYRELVREEKYEGRSNRRKADSPRSFFCKDSSGNTLNFNEELLMHIEAAGDSGMVSILTGNHDSQRIRRGKDIDDLKVAYTALFMLPGVPVLYYGDEIGMRNIVEVGNVEGSYYRGSARTPMQWAPGEKVGFSTAPVEDFYIMPDPDTNERPDVQTQNDDPESLLNYTRKLFALRHSNSALDNCGKFRPVVYGKSDSPWLFERSDDNGNKFLIVLNPEAKSRKVTIPAQGELESLINFNQISVVEKGADSVTLELSPVSAAVFKWI